jgi:hypothetical protein|tara:strand:+ start:473 stop:718 length:246 start_codon:yes stop_codon:yes gene_type:complete
MQNLWTKLKPEHKETIKGFQKEYSLAPQSLEKALKTNNLMCDLTVQQLRDLFTWTDQDLTDIHWQDIFGSDKFFSKNPLNS